MLKRCISFLVALCIVLLPCLSFAEEEYVTRGEVADVLLKAADFYNPAVLRSDIIKGYGDGDLHENENVTRAQALVMLKRAFGNLPEPTGHNERVALKAGDFDDVPQWAKNELNDVFDCGIAAGTAPGVFSPDSYVTKAQLELFIKRVYALYGTNLKDDFYASVNKELLEKMTIPDGEYVEGTVYAMQTKTATRVDSIIRKIVAGNHKKGTPEQKMKDLYNCVMDEKERNKNSLEPIKEYFGKIDSVRNISELSELQNEIAENLCVNPFAGFSLTVDFSDSSGYLLCFETMRPLMHAELYFDESETQQAYITYLEKLLILSGEDSIKARSDAQAYFMLEKVLAENMMSAEENNNFEKIYNIFSYNKLNAILPDCDIEGVLDSSLLEKEDTVIVFDPSLMYKFAELYNQSNIDAFKVAAKIRILNKWGQVLSTEIEKEAELLNRIVFGVDGVYTRSQKASIVLQNTMSEYLGKMYIEQYFDEKEKDDVLKMTEDIIRVFKKRINSLSWMSEETKQKAILKLDTMKVQIGAPDSFETFIDNVDIKGPDSGGTYFSNMMKISKELKKNLASLQHSKNADNSWPFSPYTVNAGYSPTDNSIVFPAAILEEPLYDKNSSYEKNLGSIGYIIAHEIVHAFDTNGALFDEEGNKSDWWNEQDYAQFKKLCEGVTEFYDGYEAVPAIRTNGALTLSENVADLGGAACITELAKEKKNPDFKALYTAMANTFALTHTREYAYYAAQNDSHAHSKARVNLVVVHFDEFYNAFGITEDDAMFVPKNKRITVW